MGDARFLATLAVLATLAGCASGGGGGGQCVMQEAADLPVLNDRFQPIVRAKVNDQPVAFIVDTGTDLSMVTPKAVDALSLPIDYGHRMVLTGIGGSVISNMAEIHRLDLGHGLARNVACAQAGAFGGTVDGLPVVGLFGADFLANYDVEFDLPAHHVGLYREQGCDAHFAQPWPGNAYALPFDLERDTQVEVPIRLDGAPVVVQLDSGAVGTVLTLDDAHAAGVTAQALGGDRIVMTEGIDENRVKASIHRFASLAIGPEHDSPAWVAVGDVTVSLLGASFLRTHRVWISYPHKLLWVQPMHARWVAGPAQAPAAPHA